MSSVFPKRGWYGHIGGGIGTRKALYTLQEQELIKEYSDPIEFTKAYLCSLKDLDNPQYEDKSTFEKEQLSPITQFKGIYKLPIREITDVYEEKSEMDQGCFEVDANQLQIEKQLRNFLADSNHTAKSWGGLFQIGGGYRFSHYLTFEAGYSLLASHITPQELNNHYKQLLPFSLIPMTSKNLFAHGLYSVGKVKLFAHQSLGLYVQAGGGFYRGYFDHLHEIVAGKAASMTAQATDSESHRKLPKIQLKKWDNFSFTPALIIGGGGQWQFSDNRWIELAWTHIRLKDISSFNFMTLSMHFFN